MLENPEIFSLVSNKSMVRIMDIWFCHVTVLSFCPDTKIVLRFSNPLSLVFAKYSFEFTDPSFDFEIVYLRPPIGEMPFVDKIMSGEYDFASNLGSIRTQITFSGKRISLLH